jgi:hypothetical protein
VCSTEFRAVCDQLDPNKYDARTESAENTYLQLTSADPDVPDAWITLDPFPEMVEALLASRGEPALGATTNIVATDVPQLAVAASLNEAARTLCGGDVSWRCVSTHAGDPLSGSVDLKLGMANPATEAAGLLQFANAVAGYTGSAVFDTNAWQEADFIGWRRKLKAGTTIVDAPLGTVVQRSSLVNVAVTTRAEASASAQPSKFVAVDVTSPVAFAANVAVFGASARDLPPLVGTSLVQAGWVAAAAPTSSLDAGTFIALQNLWKG